jgi:alpha-1,3-rhamnosyl/mannosyltransferase
MDPHRVTVVPNAADDRFYSARPLGPEQRNLLRLPDRYLLTVGTIEPRKNHLTLFAALDLVPPEAQLPLVVAGRIGWNAESIVQVARNLERSGRVILLEYVAEDLLPGLYAGAEALVYPSWYEGFGLPVLEGLASGTRVIASDVPSHREVAGKWATFVPPDRPEAIAEALTAAANDGCLEPKVVSAQREWARRYSWNASGRMLAKLLSEVVAS